MAKPCPRIGGKCVRGADLIGNEPLDFSGRERQSAAAEPPEIGKSRMRSDRNSLGLRAPKSLRHDLGIAGMKAAGDIDARDNIEHGGVVADLVGAKTFAAIAIQIDAAHGFLPLWRRRFHAARLPGRIGNNFLAPITLHIKQRGQIAVIDPRMGGARDLGFGVKGNAEPRGFEHREIVGAVANRKSLGDGKAMFFAQMRERRELGVLAEDGRRDKPAKPAVLAEKKLVRLVFVKADPFRDDGCKDREPARNEHGMRAIRPHGLNQHTSTRRQGNSVGNHVQDGGAVEALKKSHTLPQRRFEGDFAAHRASGDRGDLGPLADFSGEFVDTFLADHGRIHVGQQELLAPPLRPLHDNIDGGVIESGAHPIRDGSCAGGESWLESKCRRQYKDRASSTAPAVLRLRLPAGAYLWSKPEMPDRRQALQHASLGVSGSLTSSEPWLAADDCLEGGINWRYFIPRHGPNATLFRIIRAAAKGSLRGACLLSRRHGNSRA